MTDLASQRYCTSTSRQSSRDCFRHGFAFLGFAGLSHRKPNPRCATVRDPFCSPQRSDTEKRNSWLPMSRSLISSHSSLTAADRRSAATCVGLSHDQSTRFDKMGLFEANPVPLFCRRKPCPQRLSREDEPAKTLRQPRQQPHNLRTTTSREQTAWRGRYCIPSTTPPNLLAFHSQNLWTETVVCNAHVPCPSPIHRHRSLLLPKQPPMTASLSTKNSGDQGTSPGRPTFRSAQRPVSPFVVVPCSRATTSAERTFVPPVDIDTLKTKACPAPPADTPTDRDCLAATPPGTILDSHRGVAGFYSGHTPRLQDFAVRPPATWCYGTMP